MHKWKEMYKQKLTIPEEAVKLINDGDRIIVLWPMGSLLHWCQLLPKESKRKM